MGPSVAPSQVMDPALVQALVQVQVLEWDLVSDLALVLGQVQLLDLGLGLVLGILGDPPNFWWN